jgi:hypothetical protein
MFGEGATLEDDDDDLVEAQPVAMAATASERRGRCLTAGIGMGDRESEIRAGCWLLVLAAG